MIDVKIGVLREAQRDEVHERLELCLLLLSGESPKPGVLTCRVDPPEEILEPQVLVVGISFEVEEDVVFGGSRKCGDTLALDDGCEQLVAWLFGSPPLELDAGLLADPLCRDRADAVEPGCDRQP